MKEGKWTEGEVLELSRHRDALLEDIARTLAQRADVVFTAKLGFGIPPIDLVSVDIYRAATGYVLKLPVVNGRISTLPYYQGFGESIFLPDQMLDYSYLLVPDMELLENNPYSSSPDPFKRLRKETYESGICLFNKAYELRVLREPRGSLERHFWRLKLELFDTVLSFGRLFIADGREKQFEEWKRWVEGEFEALGEKRLLNSQNALEIAKRFLEERNYHSIKLELSEGEVEARPKPIPIFQAKGTAFYLGDDKEVMLRISRISGQILGGEY